VLKAAKAEIRTSPPTIWSKTFNNSPHYSKRGYTLIELLLVIALVSIITTLALPTVSSYFKISLNSATRELASIIKESYNSTVVSGKVHRIAYDLKKHQYWVEIGPESVLLDTSESKEKEERRKKFRKDDEKPKQVFALQKMITSKKMNLPRGVEFVDIYTEQSEDPIKDGIVYTHIFPHGVTEQALIHLKDTDDHMISLVISPLLGTTKLIERKIEKGEAFGS